MISTTMISTTTTTGEWPLYTRSRLRKRRSLSLMACCAVLLGSTACTSLYSDGQTPQILDLRMMGQAPDASTVMLIEADFFDPDGDLGEGALETFIDANPTSLGGLAMLPIFVHSGVPLDATEGTLSFVLELSLAETLPESGTQFSLGVVVTDAAQHSSERRDTRIALTY